MTALVKDCRDPWTEVDVQADGEVWPCCHSMLSMGSLHEETLDAIWDGPRLRTFRAFLATPTPLPVCATCFVRGFRSDPGHAWRAALRRARAAASRLLHGGHGTAHQARIWTSRPACRDGDLLQLSIAVTVGTCRLPRTASLFVWAELPSAARAWLHLDGRFLLTSAEPVPLLRRWEPFSFEQLDVARRVVRGLDPGEWAWTVALTPDGAGFPEPSSWLASATCAMRVEPPPAAAPAS